MRLPSKRWLTIAAGLALIAPLAVWWPWAAALLVLLDLLWIGALSRTWLSRRRHG